MSKNENLNNNNEEIKYDERGREQVKAWYALVVLPGREIKIREKLEKLSQNPHLKEQIFRVMVPAIKEEKTDAKGRVKIKENLIYTQYVYIEMILNDYTYHAVKIDGVRHILGLPTPVPEEDIKGIYEMMGEKYEVIELIDNKIVVGDEVTIVKPALEVFKDKKAKVVKIENEEVELLVNMDGNEISYTSKLEELEK